MSSVVALSVSPTWLRAIASGPVPAVISSGWLLKHHAVSLMVGYELSCQPVPDHLIAQLGIKLTPDDDCPQDRDEPPKHRTVNKCMHALHANRRPLIGPDELKVSRNASNR
jgi:hypothetical protein